VRAVICGAGVAGLTLAIQLGRAGWDVIVLEHASGPPGDGFLIELADEGLIAAERIGLLPKIKDVAEALARVRWVDEAGGVIADIDFRKSRGAAFALLRGDLQRMLLENLPSSVEVRFGFEVTDIRTRSDGVEVALHPIGRLSADLLVGADGIHSRIRELVFDDGGLSSKTLGYDAAAFTFEDEGLRRLLGGRLNALSVLGRHIVVAPLRSGKVATTLVHRSTTAVPPADPVAHLKAIYGDLRWCVPALLDHAGNAAELQYEQTTQIKLPCWFRGRIGLLGDACHAYSLLPGQGTSITLSAAAWLGTELTRAPSVDVAFAWYQGSLMGEVAKRRASTRKTVQWLVPSNHLELTVRNSLLRLSAVPALNRLVRPVIGGMA
jgi:2-polyprenyl-6-methoxyphenol hydroxylase-like FAD-dependent oxidoreductase